MEFKKYNSIENHYNEKNIMHWITKYPELNLEKFIIQEKIHGSNFSIWFEKKDTDIEVKFGKRTSFLEETESFFDWQNTIKKENVQNLIKKIKEKMNVLNIPSIILFGELYGTGVQKGIYYSQDKNIKFFDMKICNLYISQNKMLNFFKEIKCENMLVPIIGYAKSLKEALEINTEFNSHISDKQFDQLDNICEGVVIKPFEKVYMYDESVFYIKKKNEKFLEKSKSPKKQKIYTELSKEYQELKNIFSTYFTENRLDNVFSKYGEIQEIKEIGKYINLLIEDAKQDFFKEYKDRFVLLENREKKELLKMQKLALEIIQKKI